jgi:hypothetical protein
MSIKLTHIGEILIAEMLNAIAQNHQRLARLRCAITGRCLAEDINDFHLGETLDFRAEAAQVIVKDGDQEYACDGEQKVDVICTGFGSKAIAFEAKLGESRMAPAEFRKRFCVPCVKSTHSDARLSGSMIAVLQRDIEFGGLPTLVAKIDKQEFTLLRPWWLVLRQSVIEKWVKAKNIPVIKVENKPDDSARVLSFESLAQIYGSEQEFDSLVKRLVGSDFADRWGIKFV